MNLAAKKEKYESLMHALQSGVAMMQNIDPTETSPKHLRVGVNSALLDSGALATLLIRKGIITEEEYIDVLLEMTAKEVENYEKMIQERTGGPSIRLG